jgi:SNF2 family DNA or RNA helicase
VLETDGISHATLQGSQARIAKLIREFEAGKYRVLFLNARNMGAGLNITPATHVVLYHRMSAETQNQIIGRAMRMGRVAPLTVVHLLHGNEMTVSDAADVVSPNVISHV